MVICALYVKRVVLFCPSRTHFHLIGGDTAPVENAHPRSSIILNRSALKINIILRENGILKLVAVEDSCWDCVAWLHVNEPGRKYSWMTNKGWSL